MQRYTTKHDDDLRLGSESRLPRDESPRGSALRECLAVLNERIHHLSTSVRDLAGRLNFAEAIHRAAAARFGDLSVCGGGSAARTDQA